MFATDGQYKKDRHEMIERQLKKRGINNTALLHAFDEVPRELFVLPQDSELAYGDNPLPIGFGQTISQPYIVAYMIEQLQLKKTDTVLEIGTGSGYSAAIMSHLCKMVYSLEIVSELYERSTKLFSRLHLRNIETRLGNGYKGLEDIAPFDKIILTAAPEVLPETLLEQLKIGGRLIAPIGPVKLYQRLMLFERLSQEEMKQTELMGVSFVEMVKKIYD